MRKVFEKFLNVSKKTSVEIIRGILDGMQRCITIMIEVMYQIDSFVLILIFNAVFGEACIAQYGYADFITCDVFLIWFCAAIKHFHAEIKKHKAKEAHKNKRRFTTLDAKGNPSIKKEDLPEIIEYLYALEECDNES